MIQFLKKWECCNQGILQQLSRSHPRAQAGQYSISSFGLSFDLDWIGERCRFPTIAFQGCNESMESGEKTRVAVRIATFDSSGFPVNIAKNLGIHATVTFQIILLEMLISRSLDLGQSKVIYIRCKDNSLIRVERTLKGFVGYLEMEQPLVES